MLILTRTPGEKIRIGDDVVIAVMRAGEVQVSLGIEAPRAVPVFRAELLPAAEAAVPTSVAKPFHVGLSSADVECLLSREDLGMQMTLEEATKRLSELENELPRMISEHPEDGDFWSAFAGAADDIVDSAPEHAEYIQGRLNCMLGAAGLVPSDNEGEDCVP